MAALKTFPQAQAIPERSTYRYRVELEDEAGVDVQAGQVDAIYLSLRDLKNNAIVNSRSAVAVKNANGGTLITGQFEMQFAEADMAVFGSQEYQPRSLTLDFRLGGGGRATREVRFWVRAMADIA